jgi:hypothetical protein
MFWQPSNPVTRGEKRFSVLTFIYHPSVRSCAVKPLTARYVTYKQRVCTVCRDIRPRGVFLQRHFITQRPN